MKHLTQNVWKSAQGRFQRIDSTVEALQRLVDGRRQRPTSVSYSLKPAFVRSFANSGYPFLTFYEFNDLAGWCRDIQFAPDHVPGYEHDAGRAYTVWTHEAVNIYRRHILLSELETDITVTFGIPSLTAAAWFPLRIRIEDRAGLFFQTDQKLVVERLDQGAGTLTSWKKIPALADCLPRLHALSGK